MPQLGFYRISFEKTIATFQISTLEYVKMLSFIQKERTLNLAPEMLDLVIFGMKFEDLQTFRFRTKNTLFSYFCDRI